MTPWYIELSPVITKFNYLDFDIAGVNLYHFQGVLLIPSTEVHKNKRISGLQKISILMSTGN